MILLVFIGGAIVGSAVTFGILWLLATFSEFTLFKGD